MCFLDQDVCVFYRAITPSARSLDSVRFGLVKECPRFSQSGSAEEHPECDLDTSKHSKQILANINLEREFGLGIWLGIWVENLD